MPNDTPDFQPGSPYTAVVVPSQHWANGTAAVTVPVAQFTSLLVKLSPDTNAPMALQALFQDTYGQAVGVTVLMDNGLGSYVKIPVAATTMILSWQSGAGVAYVLGGYESLQLAAQVSDLTTMQDGTQPAALSYSGPTTAGTAIKLGTTHASGRVSLAWQFSSGITGYLFYRANVAFPPVLDTYIAASSEAVTLPSTTTAKYLSTLQLPAQPIDWYWVPQTTSAATNACSIRLVRG